MAIIQEDLNEIRHVWNAHRIRPSTNANVPAGIPNIMYTAPHLWGADDLLVPFRLLTHLQRELQVPNFSSM
ncbi:hypothetical protein F7725_005162 [Dissostichus mawsoni]|uniref:Uncharacterized protein n=1 Tax=Dissostichus mawsoni TaxID=36200 RepID=A0A7J5YTM7_DISMA|nr:hypothetical protein F7725_005162 [Dissostichus mawsoni]